MADWYKSSLAGTPSEAKDEDLPFRSRRSPVICRNGCVASSQPLASSIGLDLLRKGANAADVAVAVAAALAVTEPCSTGLGGDMFCLYFDSSTQKVSCINGSGLSPAALTLDLVRSKYPSSTASKEVDAAAFRDSPLSVTVPGAAQGWEDLLARHGSGKFTLLELLEPSAVLAEEGFPVGPVTSHHWRAGMQQISKWLGDDEQSKVPLTTNGKDGPLPGEIVYNPVMARVLRDFGKDGAQK